MATEHRTSHRTIAEVEIAVAAIAGYEPADMRGWVIIVATDEYGVQLMGCCDKAHSIALMSAATAIAAEHISEGGQ